MLRGVPFDQLRIGFAPKHLYHDVRDPSVATNAPSHRPDVLREGDTFRIFNVKIATWVK